MKKRKKHLALSVILTMMAIFASDSYSLAIGASPERNGKPLVIKMATLAPSGSPWHETLKEMAIEWAEISDGQVLLSVVLSLLLQSCVKRLAVNSIANALTEGSAIVYARDDDPVLVGEALPFALKTMETLLEQTPNNKKLLIATASGFVQYAHAFVLQPANTLEFTDLAAARDERDRAKRLFLRARTYALRALELNHDGITERLTSDPAAAVSTARLQDIHALYWAGVAWGSAISISKSDMSLVGEVPIVRSLLERALALAPDWEDGAIHEFFIHFHFISRLEFI